MHFLGTYIYGIHKEGGRGSKLHQLQLIMNDAVQEIST